MRAPGASGGRSAAGGAAGYGAAFADVYDAWYPPGHDAEQAAVCLCALAGGGAVLELGVGTGRIALRLAACGVEVWGLDASAEMLAALARKDVAASVVPVLGDMEELALPDRAPAFAVVFAAFNTLFLLTAPGAQERCLRRAAEVLTPEGCVVLELYLPAPAAPGHERWDDELVVPGGTRVAHRYQRGADGVYVGETGGRPWALRPLPLEELDATAAAAGLVLEHRWTGWDEAPFLAALGRHVSVYRRR